jgi:uncharacterized tellurite resistance protein B-like protein
MLDRLKSFFDGLSGDQTRDDRIDDPRIASASLMIHVIDVDGERDKAERARLHEVLSRAYGVAGVELDRIVAKAEEADREAVDLFAFTSILNRQLDEQAKVDFIGLLWEIVFADGEMHELEDNVVWRVAELIGVSPRDRTVMRKRVREAAGVSGED